LAVWSVTTLRDFCLEHLSWHYHFDVLSRTLLGDLSRYKLYLVALISCWLGNAWVYKLWFVSSMHTWLQKHMTHLFRQSLESTNKHTKIGSFGCSYCRKVNLA
jgi:hypothetical protein